MVSDGLRGLRNVRFFTFVPLLTKVVRNRNGYSQVMHKTARVSPVALVRSELDCFQNGDSLVFLISLKAGGTGLTLTAADTVIHYDPWWNPAAQAQATDRAYRIGQTKPVFVYNLIAAGFHQGS